MLSDRWLYTGTDLYKAYDTEQVFRNDYEHGVYCYLSPWHLSVKLEPPPSDFVGPVRPGKWDWSVKSGRVAERKRGKEVLKFTGLVLILGVVLGFMGHKYLFKEKPVQPVKSVPGAVVAAPAGARKYSEVVKATGFFRNGGQLTVMLSDGRAITPLSSVVTGNTFEAEIEPGVWVKGGEQ
jgi:hypothetical protein